jgi:hypothetical protein
MMLSTAGLQQFRSWMSLSGSAETMVFNIIEHLAQYGNLRTMKKHLAFF